MWKKVQTVKVIWLEWFHKSYICGATVSFPDISTGFSTLDYVPQDNSDICVLVLSYCRRGLVQGTLMPVCAEEN